MKKERDSFFSQYGVNAYNQSPYMYPNMNNFNNPNLVDTNYNQNYNNQNDLENRLSRIERDINNLNQRVSRLETTSSNQPINNDYNFANSMYMV